MSTGREPDQADFDLDRFIAMFDEALTSEDPRVIDALRSLMMIVALTKPEARNPMSNRQSGPLRRLFEDVQNINQRVARVEDSYREIQNEHARRNVWQEQDKYTMTAAQNLAQSVDRDVMRQLTKQTAMQVNGGTLKDWK